MLDGIDGGNTGVMVLHDGRIHGGDAFFDYIGSYTCADGRWKGELVNHEHTPSQGERPVFGGYEVGIGFAAIRVASESRGGADESTTLIFRRRQNAAQAQGRRSIASARQAHQRNSAIGKLSRNCQGSE